MPVAADFNNNFNALNQAIGSSTAITGYTTGDIVYASATNTLAKLAAGGAGTVLTMSGGIPAWVSATGFNPETTLDFFEDFIASATSTPGAGGTTSYTHSWWMTGASPGRADLNGIARIAGDGTNIPGAVLQINVGSGTPVTPFLVSKNPTLKVRFAQVTATASTRRIGLSATTLGASAEPANGIYFRFTAGGNLIAVCRSASVETTLDTTIAQAADVFHTARLVVTGGASVEVFVDGVSRGSIATNIPSAALTVGAGCSVNTLNVGIDVDYIGVTETR